MNRKKLKLVVSAMSILLAVQSPGAVLADTGQETAVEAQVSTEETVSEPGTEEILNGMGTEITQESEGYQEEILPGTAGQCCLETGERKVRFCGGLQTLPRPKILPSRKPLIRRKSICSLR